MSILKPGLAERYERVKQSLTRRRIALRQKTRQRLFTSCFKNVRH